MAKLLFRGQTAVVQAAIHTPLASDETDLRKQDARCLPHRRESDCAIGFLLLLCGRCLRRCHAKVDGAVPRIDESFDQRGIFDVLLYDGYEETAGHIIGNAFIPFVLHDGVNPRLQHGAEDSQIIAALTDFLYVATENEERREADFLCEFSQSIIVDNLGTKAG